MVDIDLGTVSGLLASRCRTSPMCAWYTSSMAQGTRYPWGSRSDSGARWTIRAVKAVLKLWKHCTWKLCLARKFCDPLERPLAVKRASLPMIFERNSERMRYARYRAQKLFVGSGVVEAWLQDCHRPKTQDVGHVLDRPRRQFPHCTPLQPHQRQIHRLLGVPCRM